MLNLDAKLSARAIVLTASLMGAISVASPIWAQAQQPAVEFAALLSAVDVFPMNARLELDGQMPLAVAFLPQGASVDAVLTKAGDNEPLFIQSFNVQPLYGAFSQISPAGGAVDYLFQEPGDYVLSFRANGQLMTRLAFSVMVMKSDDPFDPAVATFTKGPWEKWAAFVTPLEDGENAIPEFWMWGHLEALQQGGSDRYSVALKRNGDVVAVSPVLHVGGQKWQDLKFKLQFTDDKGGEFVKVSELLAAGGNLEFVVTKNDVPHVAYRLNIKDGKPVPHASQAGGHTPRADYRLPRFAGLDFNRNAAADIYWMERLSEEELRAIESAGPSAASLEQLDRDAWQWMPSVNPNRPFGLTITEVETRSDTMLSAGDEIIAFGTGFPNGVKYMQVGEDQPIEIPGGETFSSTVFRVCRKKIVLVKDKQVVVFDTESGRLVEIPQSDVSLYDVRGGLHRANLLNADGMLVVTVNNVDTVADKTIIKVIDVSGPNPKVIPIKNADYTHRDVRSVAVDARRGIVAMSCRQLKRIYAAPIAVLANQRKYDLVFSNGVNDAQIHLTDERIVYSDETGRLRELWLDDGAGSALTEEPLGRSGNGFIATDKRTVVSTAESFGTRYQMAVAEFSQTPKVVPGTGTKIEGTSGTLGSAGCAAITMDGTVFIAGTPSGGIGVGEHLQVLADDVWIPLRHDGKVISAIDVTASLALVAFKSGDRGGVHVGYATFGEHVTIPDHVKRTATASTPSQPEKPSTTSNLAEDIARDIAEAKKKAEAEALAQIEAALAEVETQLINGFKAAGMNEAESKRRARDQINAMRSAQGLPVLPKLE